MISIKDVLEPLHDGRLDRDRGDTRQRAEALLHGVELPRLRGDEHGRHRGGLAQEPGERANLDVRAHPDWLVDDGGDRELAPSAPPLEHRDVHQLADADA